jgi:hypothetical protein
MNAYELIASNATGGNVALNCAASALSWTGASNAASRMVDGVIGEVSYYNSAGSTAAEFFQVDLASGNCANAVGAPQQVYNITFVNRAALVCGRVQPQSKGASACPHPLLTLPPSARASADSDLLDAPCSLDSSGHRRHL